MHLIPQGWDQDAHSLWVEGQREPAIVKVVEKLNATRPMPRGLFAQIGYYTYLVGNYEETVKFLTYCLQQLGPNSEIQKNLATALQKLRRHDEALTHLLASTDVPQDNPDVCDLACAIYTAKGDGENAKRYGEWSLLAKDRNAKVPAGLALVKPEARPSSHAAGVNVVAFSLWGQHPRYLRSALRNAMVMGDIYPAWHMRVYCGDDVPEDFRAELSRLGADVQVRSAKAPILQRLGWRFEVANDPSVNLFMVRDIDSVVNTREAHAVHAWQLSGKSFHIMRDWWSHTDTILAGMWGGVAGLLPNLNNAMQNYKPSQVETPNIDQWFLRDQIWPLIRDQALVHDRCFTVLNAVPFPGPALPFHSGHVGQDEIAVRAPYQDVVLAHYFEKFPYLKVKVVRA
jgi:tetratricopeptide (TPR) repeat protein